MKIEKPVSGTLAVILLLGAFLFFFRLGERSLRNPDEGRYAEIAREMVLSGNWTEPKLYGVDYLRKPAFFYWLVAVSFKVFGFTELAARLVPAFFGYLSVLLTFFFARRVFGEGEAFFSSLILLSNVWFLQISRTLLIDSVFSFFLLSAFYAFYLALAGESHKKAYYLGFSAAVALAFLTKGAAGVVIPVFCLGIYLIGSRQVRRLFSEMPWAECLTVFLVIALPWYAAVTFRNPGFPRQFFLYEHFSRFFSSAYEHQERWYYYFVWMPLLFFPWTFFVRPVAASFEFFKSGRLNSREFYLFCVWFGVLLFYTASRSKLVTYLLPCASPAALLLGRAWSVWAEEKKPVFWRYSGRLTGFLLSAAVLAAVCVLFALSAGHPLTRKIPGVLKGDAALALAAFVCEGVAALWFLKRHETKKLFYSLVIFAAAVSTLAVFAFEKINADYSTRAFAGALKAHLAKEDAVFIYDQPGAFYDFAFYLDHPVKLVGLEGELELSRGDEAARAVSVSKEAFYQLLTEKKIYCLMRKSDYLGLDSSLRERLRVLMEDNRKTLVQSLPVRN
jgi:4-amino-4-deoxy-L-arabinose transferase-like glycosyltransferase